MFRVRLELWYNRLREEGWTHQHTCQAGKSNITQGPLLNSSDRYDYQGEPSNGVQFVNRKTDRASIHVIQRKWRHICNGHVGLNLKLEPWCLYLVACGRGFAFHVRFHSCILYLKFILSHMANWTGFPKLLYQVQVLSWLSGFILDVLLPNRVFYDMMI